MMGLPAGWVTEVPGLSRNDMLRILGNGVVPQCAAAAYSLLLPAWQGAIKAGEAA
jgi:DNA (cytosine-5)-methyltransferase 1